MNDTQIVVAIVVIILIVALILDKIVIDSNDEIYQDYNQVSYKIRKLK